MFTDRTADMAVGVSSTKLQLRQSRQFAATEDRVIQQRMLIVRHTIKLVITAASRAPTSRTSPPCRWYQKRHSKCPHQAYIRVTHWLNVINLLFAANKPLLRF